MSQRPVLNKINSSEQGVNTSERGVSASERGVNTPKQGVNTSEQGVNTSEQGVNTPEQGVSVSERGVNTSEQGVNTSERGVNTSEQGVKTSERGVKTSERGVNSSEAELELPLKGCEVVVTRPQHSAGELCASLERLGAEVILAPLIELAPPPEPARLRERLVSLTRSSLKGERGLEGEQGLEGERGLNADWLIFTSVNAVRFTLEAWREALTLHPHAEGAHSPAEHLQALVRRGLKVACVGQKTAASLLKQGVEVALTPERFVAEGLLEALATEDVRGARVLFPRALKGRELLPNELIKRGAHLELIPAYQTRACALSEAVKSRLLAAPQDRLRFITLTSDSSAAALLKQWEREEERRKVFEWAELCVIGPVVARFLQERGVDVSAVASPHTTEGLTRALLTLAAARSA